MAGVLPYLATSLSTVYLAFDINHASATGSTFFFSQHTAENLLHIIEPLQIGYGAVVGLSRAVPSQARAYIYRFYLSWVQFIGDWNGLNMAVYMDIPVMPMVSLLLQSHGPPCFSQLNTL